MKNAKFILGLLLILVLASCYLPQNPANLHGKEPVDKLSVLTDESRDQGMYVNEKGEEFDILGEEGADGQIVRELSGASQHEISETMEAIATT